MKAIACSIMVLCLFVALIGVNDKNMPVDHPIYGFMGMWFIGFTLLTIVFLFIE